MSQVRHWVRRPHSLLNAEMPERLLRGVACVGLVVYCCWQCFWIACGAIPPSMFWWLTGLPCPTTGGTRSFLALLGGDWQLSLHHNAMTVPLLALTVWTLGWVVWQLLKREHIAVPIGTGRAWLYVLILAWIIKLVQFCV